MNQEELEKLLGGYSTGTLSAEERARLFEAALEDQDLFEGLLKEEALREVLSDPRARRELMEAALPRRRPLGERIAGWMRRPAAWAMAGSLAGVAVLTVVLIRYTGPSPLQDKSAQPATMAKVERQAVEATHALKDIAPEKKQEAGSVEARKEKIAEPAGKPVFKAQEERIAKSIQPRQDLNVAEERARHANATPEVAAGNQPVAGQLAGAENAMLKSESRAGAADSLSASAGSPGRVAGDAGLPVTDGRVAPAGPTAVNERKARELYYARSGLASSGLGLREEAAGAPPPAVPRAFAARDAGGRAKQAKAVPAREAAATPSPAAVGGATPASVAGAGSIGVRYSILGQAPGDARRLRRIAIESNESGPFFLVSRQANGVWKLLYPPPDESSPSVPARTRRTLAIEGDEAAGTPSELYLVFYPMPASAGVSTLLGAAVRDAAKKGATAGLQVGTSTENDENGQPVTVHYVIAQPAPGPVIVPLSSQ